MPTTIAITSRPSGVRVSNGAFDIAQRRDLVAIASFSAVGLLLTIGFAVLFPLSNQWLALSAVAF